jgi:hypothetical protein
MAVAADHDHGTHGRFCRMKLPRHAEGRGECFELCLQLFLGKLVAGELNPHEKESGVVIVVLCGFFNIAAVLQQETGDRVNNAHTVRAGQGKDISVIHRG